MKVFFKEKSPRKVVNAIRESLKGRKLEDMLNFDLEDGILKISISQMGTSVMEFKFDEQDDGLFFSLSHEKIAFTHKPFMGEMREKLNKIIASAGGDIQEA